MTKRKPPRGYKVIGHDTGNVCSKCGKAAFCNDCHICEVCGFSTYESGETMPPPEEAPS